MGSQKSSSRSSGTHGSTESGSYVRRRVNDLPKIWKNPKSHTRKKMFELGILFLHFCLKRIMLNFQPNRSHPRRVNDLPKNRENPKTDTRKKIRARNTFFALLSETHRVKISAQSEP